MSNSAILPNFFELHTLTRDDGTIGLGMTLDGNTYCFDKYQTSMTITALQMALPTITFERPRDDIILEDGEVYNVRTVN